MGIRDGLCRIRFIILIMDNCLNHTYTYSDLNNRCAKLHIDLPVVCKRKGMDRLYTYNMTQLALNFENTKASFWL